MSRLAALGFLLVRFPRPSGLVPHRGIISRLTALYNVAQTVPIAPRRCSLGFPIAERATQITQTMRKTTLRPTRRPFTSWPTMPIGRPVTVAPSNAGLVFPWI